MHDCAEYCMPVAFFLIFMKKTIQGIAPASVVASGENRWRVKNQAGAVVTTLRPEGICVRALGGG